MGWGGRHVLCGSCLQLLHGGLLPGLIGGLLPGPTGSRSSGQRAWCLPSANGMLWDTGTEGHLSAELCPRPPSVDWPAGQPLQLSLLACRWRVMCSEMWRGP